MSFLLHIFTLVYKFNMTYVFIILKVILFYMHLYKLNAHIKKGPIGFFIKQYNGSANKTRKGEREP